VDEEEKDTTMLKDLSRARLAGAWCALVVVVAACSLVAGAAVTLSNGALLLMAALAPPAVMLVVWRGAPDQTIAELLHSVDGPSEEGRP
jgi:hypothetical protein